MSLAISNVSGTVMEAMAEVTTSAMPFAALNDSGEGYVVDEEICGKFFSFNFSEYEFPDRLETWRPITYRECFKILAYLVVFLVSLSGNFLVIMVVYYNAHMRSSTNQYLVNLAFADLLVTMGSMWVHLVRHLSYPHYVLPAIVCKFDAFIQATALLGSVLTLVVISVGRFVAVMFPFLARTSPDRAHRVIAGVWLTSACIASPILVYRQLHSVKWQDATAWHCEEWWPKESRFDAETQTCITTDSKIYYYTFLTVAFYFLPIVIMLVNYSLVVWRLWMTQLPGEHSDPARNAATRAKRRVVRMISVVLLVFTLCWTPLQSIILYSNFGNHSDNLPEWFGEVEFTSYFVAYLNSALNPIIYCGFNANFRQGLMALLRCRPTSSRRTYRFNWRGLTARTRETTVASNDPGVLLDLQSTHRTRISHRSQEPSARISLSGSCTELRQNAVNDVHTEIICRRCYPEAEVGGVGVVGEAPRLDTQFGDSVCTSHTIYNNHSLHHDLHNHIHRNNHHQHHNHTNNHGHQQSLEEELEKGMAGQNGGGRPARASQDSGHSAEGVGCGWCKRQNPIRPSSTFHRDVEVCTLTK